MIITAHNAALHKTPVGIVGNPHTGGIVVAHTMRVAQQKRHGAGMVMDTAPVTILTNYHTVLGESRNGSVTHIGTHHTTPHTKPQTVFIQTNFTACKGDSGDALFNREGACIGMITATLPGGIPVTLAIPSNDLMRHYLTFRQTSPES